MPVIFQHSRLGDLHTSACSIEGSRGYDVMIMRKMHASQVLLYVWDKMVPNQESIVDVV